MKPTVQSPPHPSLVVAPQILIVDDDQGPNNRLAEYLAQYGMRVTVVAGAGGVADRLRAHPSLVIIALNVDQSDGLDLLRDIRRASETPVIIVASRARDVHDRIVALELGADDYMTKPFDPRELLARIRTILRRQMVGGKAPCPGNPSRFRFGPWELDRSTLRLSREGASSIRLTKGEYALLHAFLTAPQRTLSREHLLRATRIHEDVFDRSIDVRILRLRRKLEIDPSAPRIIETVRGLGYVFRAEVEAL